MGEAGEGTGSIIGDTSAAEDEQVMKYTIKDSVFTNIFKEKKYLLQLYKALHPEDHETTEDDLKDVTVRNVLVDDIYNDVGFTVGSTLLILIEAQSTWTENIIFRALMYLTQTYREYFKKTKQNLYKSKKVKAPRPEIYVIYTGDRKTRPTEISLSEEFFGGEKICLDLTVKMIYDGKKGDIINQYVVFTKICNEQVAIYGRKRKAIQEAVRICKDEDVLREYLERRENEVVDIMAELFDQEEVLRSYIESERYEAAEEEAKKAAKKAAEEKLETAKRFLKMGKLTIEEVAAGSGLTVKEVEELAGLSVV